MFNSWFHIRSLARYLQAVLPEAVIGSSYTYQKDELVIPVNDCVSLSGLRIAFHQPLPGLQLETELTLPKRKVPLLKSLTGLQVANVAWHRSDRQILISLKNELGYLLLQLYGINGNVFYLNQQFELLEAFRKVRKTPVFQQENFVEAGFLIVTELDFRQTLNHHPDFTIEKILFHLPIPVYSKILSDEILYRAGLVEKILVVNLSEDEITLFYQTYCEVLAEIDRQQFYIYQEPEPLFAMLELRHTGNITLKFSGDLITAAQSYIALIYRTTSLAQVRSQLHSRLILSLQQLQRKLSKQQTELVNLPTAGEYREWADTLLSNLHQVQGYITAIELPAISDPEQLIQIPLNPKLTPAENAAKYYEKSRQIEASCAELQESIQKNTWLIQEVTDQLRTIESCNDLKILRQMQQKLPAQIVRQAGSDSVESKPFHRFLIEDREILVGKSARDNDELSFKHARPEDFWFHAEHGPGSHVVVRNPHKEDSLPKELIEIAAGIAAFYSKAKNSTVVPVIYTKRKYIWKRKNLPPGKVFTKFTKSVIVKPVNPKVTNPT
jgi:predicted ribosome quality control (RQC) complex YloA/Tae2 family protein